MLGCRCNLQVNEQAKNVCERVGQANAKAISKAEVQCIWGKCGCRKASKEEFGNQGRAKNLKVVFLKQKMQAKGDVLSQQGMFQWNETWLHPKSQTPCSDSHELVFLKGNMLTVIDEQSLAIINLAGSGSVYVTCPKVFIFYWSIALLLINRYLPFYWAITEIGGNWRKKLCSH